MPSMAANLGCINVVPLRYREILVSSVRSLIHARSKYKQAMLICMSYTVYKMGTFSVTCPGGGAAREFGRSEEAYASIDVE